MLDCRHINEYLHTFKFKYKDIKVAEAMFEKGSFLFTFDLKSAYHSIDMFKSHRSLLGFSVQDGKTRKVYVYNSLPFGLSTSGHIFTKVLRVVVQFWRANRHKIIMFLDDGIGGHKSLDNAIKSSTVARDSLISLGFLLADEKCQWTPVQQVTWLGHYIDMESGRIFITQDRIKRLEVAIDSLLYQIERDQYDLIHVKVLASIVGQIISLQNVIGKKVRLLTRQMYGCILSRASWNAPVIVKEGAKSELLFWRNHARSLNAEGKSLDRKSFYELCLFADASSSGYGGYLKTYEHTLEVGRTGKSGRINAQPLEGGKLSVRQGSEHVEVSDRLKFECSKCKMQRSQNDNLLSQNETLEGTDFQASMVGYNKKAGIYFLDGKGIHAFVVGDWDENEKLKSSTWREAETVRRVINSNVDILHNKKIKVYSDNKNVVSVLQTGSRKTDLQDIACKINDVCEDYGMVVCPEWIPRNDNQMADHLSRCGDSDDWSINNQVFTELNTKWGPHTIDRFASQFNAKCRRFNSRFWVPGTEGINGLDQKWSGEVNWLVPPPRLVTACIKKLEAEKANGTLIIPVWNSAAYWLELFNQDGFFKAFVNESIILPPRNLIVEGRGKNGIFGRERLSFKMIALKARF